MITEELIQQAVGGVTRGTELVAVASLIMPRLLLTAAEILPPNGGDLKINFGNQLSLEVRVVEHANVPGIGKYYSLLQILERGADERWPLSFEEWGPLVNMSYAQLLSLPMNQPHLSAANSVHPDSEIIVPILKFHEQNTGVTLKRGLIRAVRPPLELFRLLDYKTDTPALLPGTPLLSFEGPHHGIVSILSHKLGTGLDSYSQDQNSPLYPVMSFRDILKVSRYLKSRLPSPQSARHVEETERPEAPAEGESMRYPVATFHHLVGANDAIVPPPVLLTELPPGGKLEFRFRLDECCTGIPYVGTSPTFRKPAEYEYPLALDVDVWSEHLSFDNDGCSSARRQIEVRATGPSTEAQFAVFLPPNWERKASTAVFVFVRYKKFLLSAFRVHVPLKIGGGPQTSNISTSLRNGFPFQAGTLSRQLLPCMCAVKAKMFSFSLS